jgi:Flp pilus assembly protein TadG
VINTAKSRARSTAGNALIELAITMPILLALLVGITDFGRYAYAAIEVANAAHAGAIYGSQSQFTACDTAGMQAAATSDAANVTGMTVTTSGGGGGCANTLCACSNSTQTISACSSISCGSNRTLQYVKVNTSESVTPIFNYPGFPASLTVQGQAIMRVAQ